MISQSSPVDSCCVSALLDNYFKILLSEKERNVQDLIFKNSQN